MIQEIIRNERLSFPDSFDGLIFSGALSFLPILLWTMGCKSLVDLTLHGAINPHVYTLSFSRQINN